MFTFEVLIKAFLIGGMFLLAFLNFSPAVQVNRKANIWFGVFAIFWSTFWLDEMLYLGALKHHFIYQIGVVFIQFLVPLTFLISVYYYTNPDYKFGKYRVILFLVPLLILIALSLKEVLPEKTYHILILVLFFNHAITCVVLAYFKVHRHQKLIQSFSSHTQDVDLRWIKYIIYAFIASSLLILAYNLLLPNRNLNIFANLFFLFILYLVAFYSIRQKEIFPKGLDIVEELEKSEEEESNPNQQKIKLMNDEDLMAGKERLMQLMEQQEAFLDTELNLLKLANRMELSSHQLSYIINNGFQQNFFQFINSFRVERAKELLLDPKMMPYNIVSIGFSSGFNSKTAFNTVFKNSTGLTPTSYRQQHRLS